LGSTLLFNQGLTGRVARTKKPLPVVNPSEHPDYFHIKGSDEERYASYLGIPLVHDGRLLGVLTLQTVRSKLFLLSDIRQAYISGRCVIEKLVRMEYPAPVS
jgi:L-methionine (R)-S-oxide reductase